jgi:hypothetical protein
MLWALPVEASAKTTRARAEIIIILRITDSPSKTLRLPDVRLQKTESRQVGKPRQYR